MLGSVSPATMSRRIAIPVTPVTSLIAMPDQAAQGGHGRIGPEASAQEAKGVQLLDPLAVEDVGLATGHALDVAGVDWEPPHAPLLQDLVERDPVAPRGLHGDGVDSAGLEPVGQRKELVREALELPHRLIVPIFGNGDPVAL